MLTLEQHPAVSVLLVSSSVLDRVRALLLLAAGIGLFLVRRRLSAKVSEWAGALGLVGA
jgi:hypothetical protein